MLMLQSCAHSQGLDLPVRSNDAMNGTEFKDFLIAEDFEREEREKEIFLQFLDGNIPESHREFIPVEITEGNNTITIFVTPDYISIGSDADYFHMPLTPIVGQLMADRVDCIMPTRQMVDEIWSASSIKVAPSPIPPSPAMVTVPVFWDHEQTLRGQFSTAGLVPGDLVGGHKKDVVITTRLYDPGNDNNVAIYGWHYQNGNNIQPLYLGHADFYADYSHGVRLVSETALLNGTETPIRELLSNPTYSGILSDEGNITRAEYPIKFITLPVEDEFTNSGREISRWVDRFKTHEVVSHSPSAPNGDGQALLVRDNSGGIDTARLQPFIENDYTVTAMIYCDYRPELSSDGFDRVGIFVRDDGNGMFEGISSSNIQGNNYALTWDSDTGLVQCLKTVNGVPENLMTESLELASSGWRKFSITANGDQLVFMLDDEVLLNTSDTTHPEGYVGIGYHEYFNTNSNLYGTVADRFSVTAPLQSVVGNTWATN